MALPVRLSRGQAADPMDFVRNDFNTMLSRLFTRGLIADVEDVPAVAAPLNYGVDIREDDNHIYVEADLPGFRKEDIDISLENGMLTIVAEHREEITEPAGGQAQQGQSQQRSDQRGQSQSEQPQGQQAQGQQREGQEGGQARAGRQQKPEYLLRERVIRRFVRSFTLPANVDESNVQASLENGVLKIVLNKREESKAKKIQVS
jgi:HSP20 family protein